ncbi:MAG: hypothetical protein ACLQMO_12285 [Acidobacteriaceae bacterium]
MKGQAKQIVYRYNGDVSSEEVVVDYDGEFPTPQAGDIVERNGKNWKAVQVMIESSNSGAIPILRAFLTDQL